MDDLSDSDLADVIEYALATRRVDVLGTRPIDRAAEIAVRGALGLQLDETDAVKAERIADVARGAHLAPQDADTSRPVASLFVRELAGYVDTMTRHRDRPRRLVRLTEFLDEWRPDFACERVPIIDAQAVAAALTRPSRHGRVAGVALAIGIYDGTPRQAFDAARAALRAV